MGAGSLALLASLLLLILTKAMCENVDNLDEDDDGMFKDKRDML